MWGHVVFDPSVEVSVGQTLISEHRVGIGLLAKCGWSKKVPESAQFGGGHCTGAVLDLLPLGIDLSFETFRGHCSNQNFNARFVFVVTATVAVVHPHQRFAIGQQVFSRQLFSDQCAQYWSSTKAAAGVDVDQRVFGVVVIAMYSHANVVNANGGSVLSCAGDGNFEFAG